MDILVQLLIWLFKTLFGSQEEPAELGPDEKEGRKDSRRGPYDYGDGRPVEQKTLAQLLAEARAELEQGAPGAPEPAAGAPPRPATTVRPRPAQAGPLLPAPALGSPTAGPPGMPAAPVRPAAGAPLRPAAKPRQALPMAPRPAFAAGGAVAAMPALTQIPAMQAMQAMRSLRPATASSGDVVLRPLTQILKRGERPAPKRTAAVLTKPAQNAQRAAQLVAWMEAVRSPRQDRVLLTAESMVALAIFGAPRCRQPHRAVGPLQPHRGGPLQTTPAD